MSASIPFSASDFDAIEPDEPIFARSLGPLEMLPRTHVDVVCAHAYEIGRLVRYSDDAGFVFDERVAMGGVE